MLNFAFGAPFVPPAPPASPWVGLSMKWRGWDGSVWDLTRPRSGRFLQPGVRGLREPDYERHSLSSPAVPGSTHQGTSTLNREVFWPLYEYNDAGSAEFLEWKEAFWKTLDPDRVGTWIAELPGGESRYLDLRYTSMADGIESDPLKTGWLKSPLYLLADKPYWRGETVRHAWGHPVPKNYDVTEADRAANGWAPDVIHYLSPSLGIGEAKVTNAGHVPAFPVWTAIGPTTHVTFGVGSSVIDVTLPIPAGYAVQFDTDPRTGRVLWYGPWSDAEQRITSKTNRTKGSIARTSKFVPIPAGEDRKLAITMTGTGRVLADLTPLYRRVI